MHPSNPTATTYYEHKTVLNSSRAEDDLFVQHPNLYPRFTYGVYKTQREREPINAYADFRFSPEISL